MTALMKWVETAQPGEQFVYHTGLLARDRNEEGMQGTQLRQAVLVGLTGWEAWDLYEKGKVHLRQKRLPGNGIFAYIAVRR